MNYQIIYDTNDTQEIVRVNNYQSLINNIKVIEVNEWTLIKIVKI
jgi:hypothetical protein